MLDCDIQKQYIVPGSIFQLGMVSRSFLTPQRVHCTHLCSDHDDLQNLDPHFPGNVSSGPVLLTRTHEVILQVISQALLLDEILSNVRAATKEKQVTNGNSCTSVADFRDTSVHQSVFLFCVHLWRGCSAENAEVKV